MNIDELIKLQNFERERKKESDDRIFSKPPRLEELEKEFHDFLLAYTYFVYTNGQSIDYKKAIQLAEVMYMNNPKFSAFIKMALAHLIDKADLYKNKWIEFLRNNPEKFI